MRSRLRCSMTRARPNGRHGTLPRPFSDARCGGLRPPRDRRTPAAHCRRRGRRSPRRAIATAAQRGGDDAHTPSHCAGQVLGAGNGRRFGRWSPRQAGRRAPRIVRGLRRLVSVLSSQRRPRPRDPPHQLHQTSSDRPGLAVGACVLTAAGLADAMTSHQPPKQPTPTSATPAATVRIRWVEQPNGDLTPQKVPPAAACTCCGVVYHAEDLLFGRCEGCDDLDA